MPVDPPVPHGYELEPELHRALRSRPPIDMLRWLCAQLGASEVVRVRALHGGTSCAVHQVLLRSRGGSTLLVILRRYVLDWLAEEPWTPGNEADVLKLLTDSRVRAPRLLTADPDGSNTGTPTIVMSSLPGRVDWHPREISSWLRQLAEALPEIHAVPIAVGLRSFAVPSGGTTPAAVVQASSRLGAGDRTFSGSATPRAASLHPSRLPPWQRAVVAQSDQRDRRLAKRLRGAGRGGCRTLPRQPGTATSDSPR